MPKHSAIYLWVLPNTNCSFIEKIIINKKQINFSLLLNYIKNYTPSYSYRCNQAYHVGV